MKIDFEYGQGTMTAELPDNTDIFIPGETVRDRIIRRILEEAYLDSLAHPIGMPTLSELAHKGTTVTIIVPDRVKGGEQPTSHRKMSIKYILQELYKAGVEKKDILFIISNGLHPRSKESDVKELFSEKSWLANSGTAARSSAMRASIRNIWCTLELPTGEIRYT